MILKKNILIIIQDTHLIQTFTGFLGTVFKKIYLALLSLRLHLLVFFLSQKAKVILLLPDNIDLKINNNQINFLKYSEKFSKIDLAKYRQQSLNAFENLKKQIKNFNTDNKALDLYKTKISAYLSYYYFPYLEVIDKIVKKYQPKKIWLLGNSKEEKISRFLAKKNNIKISYFSLLDISWLNNWLLKFLFKKQILKKKEDFLKIAEGGLQFNPDIYKNACLLSADFFRHLKTLVPLYKKLRQKNKKVLFVADSLEIKKVLKRFYDIKNDLFLIPQILPPALLNKIYDRKQKEYQEWWDRIFKNSKPPFAVLDDYFEAVMSYLLPLAEIYRATAEELFKKLKPKAVFCLNDMRLLENSLLQTAKNYQTKRIVVHSGIFLSPDKTNLYDVDYFSAVGENIKKELLNIGYPADKIRVNGDPQLDFLADRKIFDKKKIYEKLAVAPNKKIVLLISDKPNPLFSYQEKKEQFQNVWSACLNNKEIQLVIKPHPAESRESLLKDLESWGIKNILVTNNAEIELYELLSVVSVVIIAWSMTGFEAMLFGVPVIVANFTNKDYDLRVPYVKGGGALKTSSQEELKNYFLLLMNERSSFRQLQVKKGFKFCKLYYRLPLGKAAERIVQLIT